MLVMRAMGLSYRVSEREREKRRYHAFMFYKDYRQRSGRSLADAQQLEYRVGLLNKRKTEETQKLRRRQLDSDRQDWLHMGE